MNKEERSLRKAQKIALGGRIDEALPVIEKSYNSGGSDATISMAEIFAFRRDWHSCFEAASRYLSKPDRNLPGNVYDECLELVATSCCEDKTIIEKAKSMLPWFESAFDEQLEQLPGLIKQIAERTGLSEEEAQSIMAGVQRQGTLAVENKIAKLREVLDGADYETAFWHYESNMVHPELVPAEDEEVTDDQLIRIYSLNRGNCELLLRLHKRYGHRTHAHYLTATRIAKCYLAKEDTDGAWGVLKSYIANWSGVTWCQILPVDLITDPTLRKFMTADKLCYTMSAKKLNGVIR